MPVTHDLTISQWKPRMSFQIAVAPITFQEFGRLMIIWRNDKGILDGDLIWSRLRGTVISWSLAEEDEKNPLRRTAVTMAVNTLSYSELRAVSYIPGAAQWQ